PRRTPHRQRRRSHRGGYRLSRNDAIENGSATVSVALFGVSPNSWCSRFHSPTDASGRVLPVRRRDAYGSGRDDRAPHQSTASFRLSVLPASYRQKNAQHCQRDAVARWQSHFFLPENQAEEKFPIPRVCSSQSGFKKVSRARRNWLVPVKLRACDKTRGRGRPRPIFESTLRSPTGFEQF